MSRSSTKVFALEVMGRHAGWGTAACALAAEHESDAPHILLLPEVTFDQKRFLTKVEEALERYDHCVIALSEGIKGRDGKFLSASEEDAFGHAQLGGVAPVITKLISANLGCKCHWAVPDYLQRSARHLASMTDVEQAYAFHGMPPLPPTLSNFLYIGKHVVFITLRAAGRVSGSGTGSRSLLAPRS